MNIDDKLKDWGNLRYEIHRVSSIYNQNEFREGVEKIGKLVEDYKEKYHEDFCIHIKPDWDRDLW